MSERKRQASSGSGALQTNWLGQMLREERHRRGMTQQQLADELGVSQPEVARWESGRVKEVSLRTRERLAEAGIDRTALGLAGVQLEKVRADIEAAHDEAIYLGKPLIALAVITPSLRWMQHLWREHQQGDRQLGQTDLTLLADAYFTAALIGQLVLDKERQSRVLHVLDLAEQAAHRLRDEHARLDRLSNILILNGNQLRKAGEYDDAAYVLARAEQLAGKAQLWRRQAEAAGLSAYAYGHLHDTVEYRASLRRAEMALERSSSISVRSEPPFGNAKVERRLVEDPVFSHDSLKEIRLRCELLAENKIEVRSLCQNRDINGDTTYHWEMYYAATLGLALLSLRQLDGLDFLERAYKIAIAKSEPSQLQKILPVLSLVDSSHAAGMRTRIAAEIERLRKARPLGLEIFTKVR